MWQRYKITGAILCIFICLSLHGCVTIDNPATGRRETLLIDTASEVSLGADLDVGVQKKIKLYPDQGMWNRLTFVGKAIARVCDRQDLAYHFRIIDDQSLNAFALPGGFIYVHKGVMDVATDDELACVLAHEIGHVAARHSVKRLQANLGYQLLIGIALGATGKQYVGDALSIVLDTVDLGYSRKDEFLADRLAVRYAKRAGFNPFGMVSFFEKLEKEARGFNLVFFSSHPPIKERIKNVKEEIATYP
jgi:predicted Zn-dependent protease